ncbi:hypothetical protein SLITK23_18080 [Streptomyces lividans]|nr:hypothetical protein SLITK23_18080 [Streptomyces lividans]
MVAGDLEVGDDQVVLQGTADAHDAAERELVERGRAAVPVDRWRPRRAAWSLLLGEVRRGLLRLRHDLLGWLLLLPACLLGLVLLPVLRCLLRCLLLERLLRGRRLLGPARVRALRGVRLLLRLLGLLLRLGLGRAGRGLRAGQAHARSVGRVAQVQHRAGAELHLLDPLPVHERAVGAAVVLDHPTAAVETDRGMSPGDPGVVENKLPLRIAS